MAAAAAGREAAKKVPLSAVDVSLGAPQKRRKQSNNENNERDDAINETHEAMPDEASDEVGNKKKRAAPFTRKNEIEGRMRSYKIRMLPTTDQERELKVCFAAARSAYNFANALMKYGEEPANFIAIRNKWNLQPRPPWSSNVSRRFEAGAIQDAVTAHKINIDKHKKNPKFQYNVKNRSLQCTKTETLAIESICVVNKIEALPRVGNRSECLLFLGNNLKQHGGIRLQDRAKVINAVVLKGKILHSGGRIQWVKNTNSFYFIWTYPRLLLPDPDPIFAVKRIVALDPGMSPFQEWYSPTSGEYGTLLTDAKASLKSKCIAIDRLRSRVDRRKGHLDRPTTRRHQGDSSKKQKHQRRKTTRRLKRKLARDCARLRMYVCEGHYNAAHFLLEKHDIVIAPILATQRLAERKTRCFGSAMARGMYTWSHRLFRQRLAYAAARYPGRHIFECEEPGTSKTCTLCGFWNEDLRLGDKVCRCPSCGVCVDRQLAGARNNFWAAYGMAAGVGWDGVGG